MRVIVKKWGNSAAVRLPAAIMASAKLHLDAAVDVHEEDGRIVIQPVLVEDYDLGVLVAGITPDNLHDEASFGSAVGKEAF